MTSEINRGQLSSLRWILINIKASSRSQISISAIRPADGVHQFRDLTALVGFVARGNGVLDAMGDVVAQDFFFGATQCRAHGGDLRDDVDAVAVLFDHARETAHLAFDPVEPLEAGFLDIVAHVGYIPLLGIRFKSERVPC